MMDILIVDDEPLVRSSMARMIGNLNEAYNIQEAEDGEEAIEKLQKSSFDLVITDIRMPAVDGLKLAGYIYKTYPGIFTVMLTGYSDFEYARTAIQYKVIDYLLKPVSIDDIQKTITKIEALLQERRTNNEIGRLRDHNLLEKKVQDLFYELPVPYYDESLFPEYNCISVISFTMEADILRKKTIRFSLKNIIGDLCANLGYPIIIVEESHISTVLFSNRQKKPNLDELMKQISGTILEILKFEMKVGIGGTGTELSDISKLYQTSLQKLGISDVPKEDEAGGESVHRLIRSALSFIEEEHANDLTLTLIAERLFVNPNYLSSLFKSETGSTFTNQLTRVRMDKAKELLSKTNLKIYQISEQVGYSDQAHFSRVFKAVEGIRPYEFRERTSHS
jgi:two-component system response regulator YesN